MNAPVTTGPRNSAAAKPLRQVANVRELLVNDQAKGQLSAVAASHMKPERMMRLMANAMRTTPQLGDCDPLSLLGSMMTCASLGLEPNTPLGHAYLIPFKNKRKGITEVQLVLGYKGMIDLARRSGHIVNIHGDVVYEGDEFSFEYGSDQHLRHQPKSKRETPIYAYCHAKLTDGEAFVVLPWDEVMAIRDASQGYKTAIKYGKKDSPWIAHQHEMAAKTAVRSLFKYLPISIELDGGKLGDALTVDDQHVDFSSFAQNPSDGPTIEGDYIEDDSVEDEAQSEPEVESKEPETAPKKVAEKPKRSTTKAPDHTDRTPHEDRPSRQKQKADDVSDANQGSMFGGFSVSEMIQKIADLIKNDLTDGAPLDETLEMYEVQLADIRKAEPDEYDAMIDEFKAFVAERDGGNE